MKKNRFERNHLRFVDYFKIHGKNRLHKKCHLIIRLILITYTVIHISKWHCSSYVYYESIQMDRGLAPTPTLFISTSHYSINPCINLHHLFHLSKVYGCAYMNLKNDK